MPDQAPHGWGNPSQRKSGRNHPVTYLIREIGSIGRQLDRAMSDLLTVNPTDLRAMSMLLGRGPMTASALAAALGMGASATSMAIERLEQLGHITRERGPSDRRQVVVKPTPSSTDRAHAALMPMIQEIDELLDEMPAADRAALQRYLQAVTETMRRHLAAIRDSAGAPT